jgi:hypothetical protein
MIGAKAASFGSMRVNDELLLVGSIPLDTPKEVFETFGRPLGRYLFAMPDGEVGPRRHWISRVHYQVLAAHPELEVVQRPAPDENGVERQFPRGPAGGSRSRTAWNAFGSAIPAGGSATRETR